MRFIRNRASLVAAIALVWHVSAIAVVSTALTCDMGTDAATDHHAGMTGHEGMSGHEGMAGHHGMSGHESMPAHEDMPSHEGMPDCPMQRQTAPVCLKHGSEHGTHDCDCPTIGCAQSDTGFMALFGAVGIVSAPAEIAVPFDLADATVDFSTSTRSLATDPLSPPPRS